MSACVVIVRTEFDEIELFILDVEYVLFDNQIILTIFEINITTSKIIEEGSDIRTPVSGVLYFFITRSFPSQEGQYRYLLRVIYQKHQVSFSLFLLHHHSQIR